MGTLIHYLSIFLFFIIFSACTSGPDAEIRVMSFNIRYHNPDDGINAWPNREELVYRTITEQNPDIIGFQEALHHQLEALAANLPSYDWYGVGREDGLQAGEYCPVFYKKARFEMLDKGTWWLSENPDSVGSIGWSAHLPRILTWMKLHDTVNEDTLFAFNTHFSHVSDEAREQSAKQVVSLVHKHAAKAPAVITGDFNFTADKTAYQIMSQGEGGNPGFTDIGNELNAYTEESTTSNGFGRSRRNRVIDFIWINEGFRAESYQIIYAKEGDLYVSDHYPVVGNITLKNTN